MSSEVAAREVPVHGPRQLHLYICLYITFCAGTVTLALRLVARRLMKVPFWFDDYLALVAYAGAVVWLALTLWWLRIGLGLFLEEVNTPIVELTHNSLLILWNIEMFYAFSLAFSKLSILTFYWRMFKTSMIKLPIQILYVGVVLWLVLRTLITIFHCIPIQKFWIPSLAGKCEIDDSKYFFGTVLIHLILDIAILALPVIEVHRLHLPSMQRIGIIAMFLSGVFVCVASVVVLVESLRYNTKDPEILWNISPIILWATVEVNLAIVSTSLPMLRPIWFLILRRPLKTSNAYSNSHSRQISYSTTHKLATLTMHKETEPPKSDSESTHHLAVPREESISSVSDYERSGNSTVVVGSVEERPAEASKRRGSYKSDHKVPKREKSVGGKGQGWEDLKGIRVTNEIQVLREDR